MNGLSAMIERFLAVAVFMGSLGSVLGYLSKQWFSVLGLAKEALKNACLAGSVKSMVRRPDLTYGGSTTYFAKVTFRECTGGWSSFVILQNVCVCA